MHNPLHTLHQQNPLAEFQAYGPLAIVSTFGEPQAEYAAVRKGTALLDLPQRGFIELMGKDRHAFLNNLLTNQTWDKSTKRGSAAGTGTYAFFLNLKGRIVADTNVLEVVGARTLIETDARLVEMLRATFDLYLFAEQVKMTNRSNDLHELALHGRGAAAVLRQATGPAPPALAPLGVATVRLFDVDAIVWRDDVCAVPGYYLIVPTTSAQHVWTTLVERFGAATELGKRMLRPIGWAAFNAARIEAGRPMLDIDFAAAPPDRPGKKLSEAELEAAASQAAGPANAGVLPAETGMFSRAVSVTKGCYLGQEIVARMYARQQVARQIAGFGMADEHLPVAGAKVFDDKGNEVGVVTSSTVSPILSNAAIGLAYLRRPFFTVGTKVTIPAEGAMREATVVETPFVKSE